MYNVQFMSVANSALSQSGFLKLHHLPSRVFTEMEPAYALL